MRGFGDGKVAEYKAFLSYCAKNELCEILPAGASRGGFCCFLKKILFFLLTFIKNDDIIIFEKGCEKSGTYKGTFQSGEDTGNAVSANAR